MLEQGGEVGLCRLGVERVGMLHQVFVAHHQRTGVQPGQHRQAIHVGQRPGLAVNPEDHQVEQVANRQSAVLQVIEVGAELFRDEEPRAGEHPVIRIAHEHQSATVDRLERRGVGKQQMTPAEHWAVRGEGRQVVLQVGPLDELAMVLLLVGDEHAQHVAQQMGARFLQRVDEDRRSDRSRREAGGGRVEGIAGELESDCHAVVRPPRLSAG
jgi:hypothetical protein